MHFFFFKGKDLKTQVWMAISLCKLMKHTVVFGMVGWWWPADRLFDIFFLKKCVFSIVSEFQPNPSNVTGRL